MAEGKSFERGTCRRIDSATAKMQSDRVPAEPQQTTRATSARPHLQDTSGQISCRSHRFSTPALHSTFHRYTVSAQTPPPRNLHADPCKQTLQIHSQREPITSFHTIMHRLHHDLRISPLVQMCYCHCVLPDPCCLPRRWRPGSLAQGVLSLRNFISTSAFALLDLNRTDFPAPPVLDSGLSTHSILWGSGCELRAARSYQGLALFAALALATPRVCLSY